MAGLGFALAALTSTLTLGSVLARTAYLDSQPNAKSCNHEASSTEFTYIERSDTAIEDPLRLVAKLSTHPIEADGDDFSEEIFFQDEMSPGETDTLALTTSISASAITTLASLQTRNAASQAVRTRKVEEVVAETSEQAKSSQDRVLSTYGPGLQKLLDAYYDKVEEALDHVDAATASLNSVARNKLRRIVERASALHQAVLMNKKDSKPSPGKDSTLDLSMDNNKGDDSDNKNPEPIAYKKSLAAPSNSMRTCSTAELFEERDMARWLPSHILAEIQQQEKLKGLDDAKPEEQVTAAQRAAPTDIYGQPSKQRPAPAEVDDKEARDILIAVGEQRETAPAEVGDTKAHDALIAVFIVLGTVSLGMYISMVTATYHSHPSDTVKNSDAGRIESQDRPRQQENSGDAQEKSSSDRADTESSSTSFASSCHRHRTQQPANLQSILNERQHKFRATPEQLRTDEEKQGSDHTSCKQLIARKQLAFAELEQILNKAIFEKTAKCKEAKRLAEISEARLQTIGELRQKVLMEDSTRCNLESSLRLDRCKLQSLHRELATKDQAITDLRSRVGEHENVIRSQQVALHENAVELGKRNGNMLELQAKFEHIQNKARKLLSHATGTCTDLKDRLHMILKEQQHTMLKLKEARTIIKSLQEERALHHAGWEKISGEDDDHEEQGVEVIEDAEDSQDDPPHDEGVEIINDADPDTFSVVEHPGKELQEDRAEAK